LNNIQQKTAVKVSFKLY